MVLSEIFSLYGRWVKKSQKVHYLIERKTTEGGSYVPE
jgi:hypothetical protein